MKNYNLKFINSIENYLSSKIYKLRDFYLKGNKYEKQIISDIVNRVNKRLYNLVKEIREEENEKS